MTVPGFSLDRLVRKEVSLGSIREKQPPQDHIGLTIAPFLDVDSDDVIFDYIKGGLQEGLAPARAEDAEAELAQKDEMLWGAGRAAIIDWSLKDKYLPSDVSRWREDLFLSQQARGLNAAFPGGFNFVGRTAADFEKRMAREDTLRRRKLDNRIEWLIMQAVEQAGISYNDGRIRFSVNFNRPSAQHNQAPASGLWDFATNANFDPIGDILGMNQYMVDTYGVKLTRCITSQSVVNKMWQSRRFLATVGVPVVGGTPSIPVDPNYIGAGYGPDEMLQVVSRATGVNFQIYDSVYQTRPVGSTTFTNNRFTSKNKLFFLPSEGDLGDIDSTELGFGKTLTSPHPEGNWQSGYYEWEDTTRDPWMHVRGSGIKAFPVMPYMKYTYTMVAI